MLCQLFPLLLLCQLFPLPLICQLFAALPLLAQYDIASLKFKPCFPSCLARKSHDVNTHPCLAAFCSTAPAGPVRHRIPQGQALTHRSWASSDHRTLPHGQSGCTLGGIAAHATHTGEHMHMQWSTILIRSGPSLDAAAAWCEASLPHGGRHLSLMVGGISPLMLQLHDGRHCASLLIW
jgi:hypothetical protein